MIKWLNIHFFKGWSSEERHEFWISLAITIALCAILLYAGSFLESARRHYPDSATYINRA